jgi:xanthine/CO dehydrogenase XdhC/CoxF family maturation factor
MLITDDGKWIGSISGGCLEGDALRKARQVMTDKIARTVTYDTREESNQNLGIGLGCNGVIDVLIEPVDSEAASNPVKLFEQFIASKEPLALATIFNAASGVGEKLILRSTNELQDYFSDKSLSEQVLQNLKLLFETKRSHAKSFLSDNGESEVFMELIQPSVALIIFGGGFDARPVSQLAKTLGWEVRVTDECVAHIAPLFFPTADKLSLCHRDFIDRDFDITPFTACVLMSHNYDYDRDVLKKLLKTETPYIGILGPRKRFEKMQAEFEQQGLHLSSQDAHRVHSPIGLDIGAETPDEIAIAIIAEIQGKFLARSGGFLKYRNAPIHQRDAKSDQVFKQVYLGTDSFGKASSNS